MRRSKLVSAVVVLVSVVWQVPALGQTYNSADYVHNLFRKYVGREPNSNELTQWVWALNKGEAADNLQVALLSSGAYFGRYGNDPSRFIKGLFADVLNRTPTSAEASQWVRYFSGVGADRPRVVRDFLKASAQELTAQKPVFETPQADPLAQLIATTQLLSSALQTEVGGIATGRQAVVMGRNLLAVTQALSRSATGTTQAKQNAYNDVRIALTALENEMRWNHLTAPTSSWYLNRFSIQFGKLDGFATAAALVPLPGQGTEPNARGNKELVTASVALLRDTQQVIFSVRSIPDANDYYSRLLRDLEFFGSQVDTFQHTLYGGGAVQSLRTLYGQLRTSADGISRVLRFGTPAGYIAADWRQVAADLEHVGRLLGVSQGATIDPNAPVWFNSPTFHHLPYQLQYTTSSPTGSETIGLVDRATGQVDAFVAGFTPLLQYLTRAPQLQAAARDLRTALIELRGDLSWSTPPDRIKTRLDRVNQLFQVLSSQYQQTIQASQMRNVPTLDELTASIRQLNQRFLSGTLLTRHRASQRRPIGTPGLPG